MNPVLFLLVISAAVLADQNGTDSWCNKDEFGCWVTGDDGARIYIMFWDEHTARLFMGDRRAVICPQPAEKGNKMSLETAPDEKFPEFVETDIQPVAPVIPVQPPVQPTEEAEVEEQPDPQVIHDQPPVEVEPEFLQPEA